MAVAQYLVTKIQLGLLEGRVVVFHIKAHQVAVPQIKVLLVVLVHSVLRVVVLEPLVIVELGVIF